MANYKRIHTTAAARLRQDYLRIVRDPVPYITAAPLPSNILEWHYVVRGPENTPYEGGFYHGKLVFPRDFPFKPPSIYMITPNGRFKVNTRYYTANTHLELFTFQNETAPTLGSVETSDFQKRQYAVMSGPFNLQDRIFCELFPKIAEEIREKMTCSAGMNATPDKTVTSSQSSLASENAGEAHNGLVGSTLINICVILGFAAFAYTVKCVLRAVENS
ncbi:predicted protein [Nematostella vectensis]|uniref:UBC core domain-containing protein n=1 Tax=Nematostella vectensis TaxID=45351 RepID=A7SCT8_NEMVE|nr:predicted protein [Nematostella vectensis]|eukprot:XP_001630521.1 predicted protein [Nematostella vectensis]